MLPAHVADDPDLHQRFEREAKTISSLNHPHICTLYDIGREGETDFLVMEYLDGETVAQRLEKGALPLDQAVRVQRERFLGKWQGRWYKTLWAEEISGEVRWHETEISRMRVKSVIARVTQSSDRHTVHGFVLHDGTPLRSVEIRVDDGPWQPATMDPSTTDKYSWKLFRYNWDGATPGQHTLVSRATDVGGTVQPTAEDLEFKQTGLENNSQFPRTVMIS